MSWNRKDELTEEQVQYIQAYGGRIAMVSKSTGRELRYSVIPSKSGKGMSVNLLTPAGSNNEYVGFITSNGGFIHTKGSTHNKDSVFFQSFQWLWSNLNDGSYKGSCELRGC